MTRSILFLLTFFIGFSVSAQISVSPNPLNLVGSPTQEDIKYEIFLTNTKDTTYNIYWHLVKDNAFPAQWATYMCDLTNCYFENFDKCPNNAPNKFDKGTHKFEFHLKPNGHAATNTLTLKLFTEKNGVGEILSVPLTMSTNASSSKDVAASSIKIFPNPATDYFQVGNGQNVNRIVIYNLFGKEVKSFFHYNNAEHEIGELKTGMYVVKMFDAKGKVIKTIKLNKAFGGA